MEIEKVIYGQSRRFNNSKIVTPIESFYTFLNIGLEKCIEKSYTNIDIKTNFQLGYQQLFEKNKGITNDTLELVNETKQILQDFECITPSFEKNIQCIQLTNLISKTTPHNPSVLSIC